MYAVGVAKFEVVISSTPKQSPVGATDVAHASWGSSVPVAYPRRVDGKRSGL
jgi:hypothetical protein